MKVHLALAWVLAHPELSRVIPGAKSIAQVEENVAAGKVTLDSGAMERLAMLRAV